MTDYELQQQLINQRRQQYAGQRDFRMPQGQMVSGHYVAPNALQYLAEGLRSIGGMRGQEMAEQELKDLTTKRQSAVAEALRNFNTQAQGTPENAPGDGMGPTMPAQAPNMRGAYAALMEAPDRQLQQFGMQGQLSVAQQEAQARQKQAEQQRLMTVLQNSTPQQAIAAGVPPELVKNYYESRNFGRDKVTFLDTGGAFTPKTEYGDVPANVAPISKTGNPFSDMLVRGEGGQLVPNEALVGAKSRVAAAGRPSVNVTNRIENKAAENIAGQVGPILKESAVAAEGAVRTLDAANRIVSAIDSGKVIAGPMANTRVSVRQAAELLGVGGKDNAEILANTRATIRGLAEMTLQGRKQMSGQGAITESESKLAEKAMSGEISDLTPAEIRQLAQASGRAANWTIQTHQSRTKAASQLPGMEGLMPFFNTPSMPGQQPAPSAMPPGFKVLP